MALARRGEVAKARAGRAVVKTVVVVVVPPPSLPAAGHTTRTTPISRVRCVLIAATSPSCAAIALFSLFK